MVKYEYTLEKHIHTTISIKVSIADGDEHLPRGNSESGTCNEFFLPQSGRIGHRYINAMVSYICM